jgi:hypothetical protein
MIVFDFHMQLHLYAALYVFSNKKKPIISCLQSTKLTDLIEQDYRLLIPIDQSTLYNEASPTI